MKTAIKERWCAALESGAYSQGIGYLCRNGSYCCLGVLCDLAVKDGVLSSQARAGLPVCFGEVDGDGSVSTLPNVVQAWAELGSCDPQLGEYRASTWNDIKRRTFPEIAALIRKHL